MSRAFAQGDLDAVGQIARGLRGDAGSYGFEVITEAAADVQTMIVGELPPAEIQPALDELIHLCLLARPASCPPDLSVSRTIASWQA